MAPALNGSARDGSARDKVLFHLKTKGPQTAADLARRLGVTPMAVRQHLQSLAADSLVSFTDERRKVGRPARVWNLTSGAARRFPDSHGDLTVDLLEAVRTTFGNDGLDRLIAARSRRQRASYEERMAAAGSSIEARIGALAGIRSDEGYMSEWSREDDGSWILAENHCPICAAATACQGFCRDELSLFRDLLGESVSVTRTDHLLAGARRCAYRIESAAAASSARKPRKAPARAGKRSDPGGA
jgi:predicted ArsR family transcriptional regulator